MPVNLTITAKSGPDKQNTAALFSGRPGILFLPDRKILQLFEGADTNSPSIKDFDLTGVTTVTCVVTGSTYAFTVS